VNGVGDRLLDPECEEGCCHKKLVAIFIEQNLIVFRFS